MSTIDDLRARFLDWLYTQSGGKTSEGIEVTPFIAEAGIDVATGFNLVRDGAAEGLMLDWSSMGSPCAALTLDGVQAAEEQQRRRTDPALRAGAARSGLLRWLYDQELAGVHMPVVAGVLDTDYARFAGDRLAGREIDRAAKYLSDKGLIEGVTIDQYDGPVRASLTSHGLDCIENHGGNVTGYLNDRAGRTSTHTYNIGTLHNAGAIALGGGDAHQQTTVDPVTIAAFTEALLNRLGTLPMDENQRSATHAATEELRSELDRPDPEADRISSALSRVVGFITDAGKPVLTALLLALAQQHGLPLS